MLTFQNLWQSEIGFPSSPRCDIDDSRIPGGDVGVERLGSGGLLVQALPPSLSVPSLRTAEAAAISLRDRDVDVCGGGGGGVGISRLIAPKIGNGAGGGAGGGAGAGAGVGGQRATVTSCLGHPPPFPHAHFCTGDVGYAAGNDGYKSLQVYINERQVARENKVPRL